MVPFKHSVDYK